MLAPHRMVLPLAPSVEARAIARAVAAAEIRRSPAPVGSARPAAVGVRGGGRRGARPGRGRLRRARLDDAGCVAGAGSARAPIAPPRSAASLSRGARRRHAPETEAPATIAPPACAARRRIAGKTSAARSVRRTRSCSSCGRRARTSRAATSRGALATIAEHVRRFRNGSLVEEREALRVKSLAGLGRHEEAQRAAAQFHARFPHSVFLPTFERMKETDR